MCGVGGVTCPPTLGHGGGHKGHMGRGGGITGAWGHVGREDVGCGARSRPTPPRASTRTEHRHHLLRLSVHGGTHLSAPQPRQPDSELRLHVVHARTRAAQAEVEQRREGLGGHAGRAAPSAAGHDGRSLGACTDDRHVPLQCRACLIQQPFHTRRHEARWIRHVLQLTPAPLQLHQRRRKLRLTVVGCRLGSTAARACISRLPGDRLGITIARAMRALGHRLLRGRTNKGCRLGCGRQGYCRWLILRRGGSRSETAGARCPHQPVTGAASRASAPAARAQQGALRSHPHWPLRARTTPQNKNLNISTFLLLIVQLHRAPHFRRVPADAGWRPALDVRPEWIPRPCSALRACVQSVASSVAQHAAAPQLRRRAAAEHAVPAGADMIGSQYCPPNRFTRSSRTSRPNRASGAIAPVV
eukprot:scaffold6790_cov99-Isochrysis_galbana.AAC.2